MEGVGNERNQFAYSIRAHDTIVIDLHVADRYSGGQDGTRGKTVGQRRSAVSKSVTLSPPR